MARITYNSINIDLAVGRNGLVKIPTQKKSTNESGSGKIETINQFGRFEYTFDAYFTRQIYYDLWAWWSWARQGKTWSFALDSSKASDEDLTGAAAVGQKDIPLSLNYTEIGSNLAPTSTCTDPDDDQDVTTGWDIYHSSTLSSETGGNTGNCLKILCNGVNSPGAQETIQVTKGKIYRFSFYHKDIDGTLDDPGWYLWGSTTGDYINSSGTFVTETANVAWTQVIDVFEAPLTESVKITIQHNATAGDADAYYFDDVTFYEEACDEFIDGDVCLLRAEDADDEFEIVVVDSPGVDEVHAVNNLKYSYTSGDTFRHLDYFPSVISREKDFNPPLTGVLDVTGKYYNHTFKFTEAL